MTAKQCNLFAGKKEYMAIIPDFSFYQFFEKEINQSAPGRPFRIEKRLPFSVDISNIVVSAANMDQFYFKDRRNRYETGAIGCVAVYGGSSSEMDPAEADPAQFDPAKFDLTEQTDRLWKADARFTLFGGVSFFDDNASPEWHSFGRFRFVLPLLAFQGDKNGCSLVLNGMPAETESSGQNDGRIDAETGEDIREDILAQLRHLDAMAPETSQTRIPAHTKTLLPERSEWQGIVDEALRWLYENGARKVVLARKKILESDVAWDPVVLLRGLAAIDEDSFLFFCRPKGGDSFLGRSPERLFNLSEGSMASDAIAGTRRRSEHPDQDEQLGAQLMASVKDIEEHRFVVDYIREQMARICDDVVVAASRNPLKLRHLQHIITRVSGRIKKGLTPVETMRLLHPTPAVGGMPPDLSREMIRRLEPFSRGWYGAPIGWMSRDAAEFAVGIRSALIRGKILHLFGGAGIVAGSDAEMEWQETGHKMENFIRILKGR